MNQEHINDRAKLIHHRLVARRLGSNPALAERAREVLEGWRRGRLYAAWMDEWAAMLRLPVTALRREVTRRSQGATRLRLTSPFAVIDGVSIKDPSLRRRLWRAAKRGTSERSTTWSVPFDR